MAAPVAIAVVSYNTRELLRACLESLRADHDAGRAEVWVVDNGSDDGSAELVRDDFGWVRLEVPGENLGFGRAVNLVAERTRTPWIAPANADVALHGDTLARLIAAGEEHPRAGALAPRLRYPNGVTQHSVYRFPTVPFTAAFNAGLGALPGLGDRLCLEGHWNADRARWVDWALGAFLLVRRSAWEAIGGFDPAQWMYAEDVDLGWRLARAGWRVRYVPGAVVVHDHSASTRAAFGEERVLRWQRATYAWMLRRRGLLRTRAVAWLNIAGAAARARFYGALARRDGRRWGEQATDAAAWAGIHRTAGLETPDALQRRA